MTTYRLWPATNGPAASHADTADSGVMGLSFKVSAAADFAGWAWWLAPDSAQNAASQNCGLWRVNSAGSGTFVAGSLTATGPLAAGWNLIPYTGAAIPLTPGQEYRAAISFAPSGALNGYSATLNYWSTGPGASGITNGILTAYSAGSGGPSDEPADDAQHSFILTGTDPSTFYPAASSGNANFWLDVLVEAGAARTATAALTVAPSLSAARTRGKFRTGALAVSPSLSAGRIAGHVRAASLVVSPSLRAAPSGGRAPAVQTGSWWGLDAVFKQSQQEFAAFVSRPPMACPWCGEPLRNPPNTTAGAGMTLYCPFDGFQYPRDYVRPVRL